MDLTRYFDFKDIYFNELIGDVWLGVFIGILLILIICIKNRIPANVIILLETIWLGAVFAATNLLIIWAYMVLVVGIIAYYTISKIIQR